MAMHRLLGVFKLRDCFSSPPGFEKNRRLPMAPGAASISPYVIDDDADRVPRRRSERIAADRNVFVIEEEDPAAAAAEEETLGANVDHPIEVEMLPDSDLVPEGCRNRPIAVDDLFDDIALEIAIEESMLYQGMQDVYIGDTASGESSRFPAFECNICVESKYNCEVFMVPGCSHEYCTECIGRHIAAKVEENVVVVGCPFPGCGDGLLDPEACKLILPPEVYLRWGKALCEATIPELDKFYCPFGDCSALLIADENGGERPKDAECPHCSRLFCARCRAPWHEGVDCEQYQKLDEAERGKEDLLLFKHARDKKWQRCPRCKVFVERTEGCVFIKCRCHHCFCYRCGSTITNAKHYCPKCQLTWEGHPQPQPPPA